MTFGRDTPTGTGRGGSAGPTTSYMDSLVTKRWVAEEIDNLRAALARLVEERRVEDSARLAVT